MKRDYSALAVFSAVVILTLALLPKTSWVVKNHLEVLQGHWTSGLWTSGAFEPTPKRIFDTTRWRTDLPESALAKAVGTVMPIRYTDGEERMIAIRAAAYAKGGRPEWRGLYIRLASNLCAGIDTPLKLKRPLNMRRQELIADLANRCAREAAEHPENSFFPLTEWAARTRLGDFKATPKLLKQAASCTTYDDFTQAESILTIPVIEGTFGYRGEIVRTMLYASSLFPHFAMYRAAMKVALVNEPPESPIRKDLRRISQVMIQRTQTLIGVYVGRSILWDSLGVPHRSTNLKQEEQPALAEAFARAYPELELGPEVELLTKMKTFFWEGVDSEFEKLTSSPRGLLAPGALIALLLTPALYLFGSWAFRFRANKWFSEAAPQFAWLAAVPLMRGEDGDALFALFVVVMIGAAFPRLRWVSLMVGCLISLTLATSSAWWLLPPALAVLAAFQRFNSSATFQLAWWPTLGIASGSVWARQMMGENVVAGMVTLLLVAAAMTLAIPPRLDYRRYWPIAICLLSVTYAGMVAWELQANALFEDVNKHLTREADEYRKRTGIEAISLPSSSGAGTPRSQRRLST